jgi:hypothetical protein
MKNKFRIIGLAGLIMLMSCGESDRSKAECLQANLVLHNTKIYTAKDSQLEEQATTKIGKKKDFVGSKAYDKK